MHVCAYVSFNKSMEKILTFLYNGVFKKKKRTFPSLNVFIYPQFDNSL